MSRLSINKLAQWVPVSGTGNYMFVLMDESTGEEVELNPIETDNLERVLRDRPAPF